MAMPITMECYCGHNCSRCVTYIATKNDDDTLRERSQRFYKEKFRQDIPLEKFNCHGGRSDNIFEPCIECPFRKCCMKRHYNSCVECSGYPCHMLEDYRAKHINKSNQIPDSITLVTPTMAHKKQAMDMVAEFAQYGSSLNGDGFLLDFLRDSSYEAWVEQLEMASDPATCPVDHAPALTYFGVRESDGQIVGMIDLRLELNDHLRIHGGHIGYAVRPTERGKHYATEMLTAALELYKERGITDLLLICSKDNAASAKVIANCGGALKDEIYSDFYREILQRYVITHIKQHTMDIVPSAFQKIASGRKTIELRLNDPKRQAIAVGDHIVFRNIETDERLEVTVCACHTFHSFEELYKTLPLDQCGYSEDELSTAHPADMYAYYTEEQIALYGVVGIEICCL